MKIRCCLIGVFPPPHGGVTIKNVLFRTWLTKHDVKVTPINVYEIKSSKKNIAIIMPKCIHAFCSKETIVYGLDTKRLRMMVGVQSIFPSSFKRTIVLAVGGRFPQIIEKHPFWVRNLKKVKSIWVETFGMKTQLEEMGFTNIAVFPNPKTEQGCCEPKTSNPAEPLHLVFFSQISKEKGVGDIAELVRKLDEENVNYDLEFYGHVVPQFQNEFEQFIQQAPKVKYCGVFDSTKTSVYQKLNEYDLLLFPTHWDTEGVPGILVEAKMAGLAVVASDRSYNSELIRAEQGEGFLIKEHYTQEMLEIIRRCDADRDLLYQMKQGSYLSRKRYALEEYEAMIETI